VDLVWNSNYMPKISIWHINREQDPGNRQGGGVQTKSRRSYDTSAALILRAAEPDLDEISLSTIASA